MTGTGALGGRWVRRETPDTRPHICRPPEQAARRDVWQCDCGRRWTCIDSQTRTGPRVTMRADWRRRFWPWPGLDPHIRPDPRLCELLGVEPANVDSLLNGPKSEGVQPPLT